MQCYEHWHETFNQVVMELDHSKMLNITNKFIIGPTENESGQLRMGEGVATCL